jgi:hypothetical protein
VYLPLVAAAAPTYPPYVLPSIWTSKLPPLLLCYSYYKACISYTSVSYKLPVVVVVVVVVVFIPDVATYVHVTMQEVRDLDLLPHTPKIVDNNIQSREIKTSV